VTGPQLYQIWGPEDFDRCAAEAIALTKPERDPAPVVDITSRERVR
jgi:hypothetical protein